MFESLQQLLPVEWHGAYTVLTAPVRWIPEWQAMLLQLAWYGDSTLEVILKRVLILLPSLLMIAAMWSTMLSMYTLPFRSGRGGFITSLLLAWWDTGRTVWLYWASFARVAIALVGYIWGFTRFAFLMVKNFIVGIFRSPMMLLDWTSRRYFQPGVPWLAFAILLLWSAVEATIFTFTLRPTLSEVLSGLTGFEPDPRLMSPLLWLFLFLLVAGSFACIQVLAEAVKARKIPDIVQMFVVEAFVMFFEVVFLYRELVDAVTPWIAQTSGGQVQLGIVATLALASFGWMGVRGMTWFLFGRFGTPALLAIMARNTIGIQQAADIAAPVQPDLWRAPVAALKAEAEWFRREAREFSELISLPVLQLLAAAVNFAVVAVSSRPVFALPFRNLDDLLAVTHAWSSAAREARSESTPTGLPPRRPTPIELRAVGQ
ncbi:MAG TPA: hypothetical protein VMM18_10540 [Gemmatimonadaceae bacterium]|nr:hypothetical protein [Gemmatimonadaceae bacterium]